MPGVLLVEAITQAGAILILRELSDGDEELMVFSGIESARFRRPVVTADQLRIDVSIENWPARVVRMTGVVYSRGQNRLRCECDMPKSSIENVPLGNNAIESYIHAQSFESVQSQQNQPTTVALESGHREHRADAVYNHIHKRIIEVLFEPGSSTHCCSRSGEL